jgi:hypothetical protein
VRAALVALCVAAVVCASAGAASAPTYCSPSGDLCYGITTDQTGVKFRLSLFAKYFNRYRICVRPPRGATTCRSFPVKKTARVWGGTVRWDRNFPQNRGNGTYRITWRQGTRALGPTLRFRLPL